jgi:aryl-alcohol dehydrogenase-like predicted oxidoreductase
VRGPHSDVIQRFIFATADMADDSLVVRLTADNFFPDSDFIDLLVSFMETKSADMVGTSWPESGLPYGLSAEAFRVSALRAAARATLSKAEREHVTPWLWRHCRAVVFDVLKEFKAAHLRCTIDTLEDYLRMQRVTEDAGDLVHLPWTDLLDRLRALPDTPTGLFPRRKGVGGAHSVLVVGTAQLGMAYGSLRKTRHLEDMEAIALVRRAIDHGVTQFDTARAYELSEERIGDALSGDWAGQATVLTKLDPMTKLPADAPDWAVDAAVESSVFASCRALGIRCLPVLMLHRAAHRTAWGGRAWKRLLELRRQGVIGKLGASVQSPAEAIDLIEDSDIEHLQMPFNILDGRWQEAGIPEALARRNGIVVHARSIYLQGVILQRSSANWPQGFGVAPKAIIDWLHKIEREFDRLNLTDLCLAYVRAQQWIDGIVIGMENENHLVENVHLFDQHPLTDEEKRQIEASRPQVSDSLLDPARWVL